jgi:hypothetical protein
MLWIMLIRVMAGVYDWNAEPFLLFLMQLMAVAAAKASQS